MQRNRTNIAGLGAALMLLLIGCGSDGSELAQRQAQVAEAGVQVMPFNLDATTHIFTETPTGWIQDVIADDPADTASIELIREHLREEADKFRRGDFSDPAQIHGPDMPGLRTLQQRFTDITVALSDSQDGATLTYETADSELVAAIHDWFDAQTTDHGEQSCNRCGLTSAHGMWWRLQRGVAS